MTIKYFNDFIDIFSVQNNAKALSQRVTERALGSYTNVLKNCICPFAEQNYELS